MSPGHASKKMLISEMALGPKKEPSMAFNEGLNINVTGSAGCI